MVVPDDTAKGDASHAVMTTDMPSFLKEKKGIRKRSYKIMQCFMMKEF